MEARWTYNDDMIDGILWRKWIFNTVDGITKNKSLFQILETLEKMHVH